MFQVATAALLEIREGLRGFSVAFQIVSEDFQRVLEALQKYFWGFWKVSGRRSFQWYFRTFHMVFSKFQKRDMEIYGGLGRYEVCYKGSEGALE